MSSFIFATFQVLAICLGLAALARVVRYDRAHARARDLAFARRERAEEWERLTRRMRPKK